MSTTQQPTPTLIDEQQFALAFGLVHIVAMEDEELHTKDHPFCNDVTSWCPCHDDHELVQTYIMRPMEKHIINGVEAMRLYWGTATPDEAAAIIARIDGKVEVN